MWQLKMNRLQRTALGLAVSSTLLLALGSVLVRVCADGGAMASAYRSCECDGFEWRLYDHTAADGPRRTLCLGWVRSWTCHQFRDGPVITCQD